MIEDGKRGYTNRVDVWAVGCIFYELIVGDRPFAEDFFALQYKHSNEEITIPSNALERLGSHWEPIFALLLSEMLAVDPKKRISVITALRQCSFHHELAGTHSDSITYNTYCTYGSSYWPLHSNWTVSFAAASCFSLLFSNPEQGQVIADVAKGFKRIASFPYLNSTSHPIMVRREIAVKDETAPSHLIAHNSEDVIWMIKESVDDRRCLLHYGVIKCYPYNITAKAFSCNGDRVICTANNGRIYFPETRSDRKEYLISVGPKSTSDLIGHWDGEFTRVEMDSATDSRFFASGKKNQEIVFMVWSLLRNGRYFEDLTAALQIELKTTFHGWVCGDLIHPKQDRVLYCPDQFNFAVIDIPGGQLVGTVNCPGESLVALTYSPCGQYILSSHAPPAIKVNIYHADTLQRLHTIHDCGGGPIRFCNKEHEICFVGPDHDNRLHLINFRGERNRIGF